ncbi:MAG: ATP-binding cassette domain-containing protein [Acidobacteria bacterium]|nr:ATP-binding cassette domain-containing protein [Acidobacteriota bacterium]
MRENVEGAKDGFVLDVDFAAAPGVTILFGASGSGKTLTLKSVAGLARPEAGIISVGEEILFDSTRRVSLPIRERRVGYVFQHLALFPHLSALANVEFPLSDLPRRERRERALALLQNFRVEHASGRLPRAISGGEAQRVALARALASDPRMLLLDEPLSALDDAAKLDIIADLKKINRELRLPILYVTHSRDEALMLGERALIYERGRIVAAGEPSVVLGAPVKGSVARLAGVENIFEGRIARKSAETGMMTVELCGETGASCRVEIPLGRHVENERVTIAVRSGDVLLATEKPRGISARNVLAGRIHAIEERGDQTLVRVSSGVLWTASVTKQSVGELGLAAGKEVWIVFKTYSCRILDVD